MFNAYVTMIDAKFKQLINVLVIVVAVLWLMSLFFGPGFQSANIRIGR